MDATQEQLSHQVERTPEHVLNRYRECRDWRLYEKEWVYHSFPPAGLEWLDFGCGEGEIATQLALLGAKRVIALDVTPELVNMTRRRAELDGVTDRVELRCGDITALPVEKVDVILSYAVLHHTTDRLREVVPALLRWLKPGGILVAVEPLRSFWLLEQFRRWSGVPCGPLDPGERKLSREDICYFRSNIQHFGCTFFRLSSRLGRIWPKADTQLRRVDHALLVVPGASRLAGTIIFWGSKP